MTPAPPSVDGMGGAVAAPPQQVVNRAHTLPDAAVIERELTAAWRAAATESVGHGGAPVARTSTGTLVALVGADGDVGGIRDTLMDATASNPSRILLVVLDEAGAESVEAQYSVFCQVPTSGRRHVCNEIIQITAGGAGVGHVPPLILGLLEPNLPVTVWATDRRQWQSPQMANVLQVADRLLVESFDEAGLRALRGWQGVRARAGARRVQVIDMAWQRLHAWRLICAELFDGVTERQDLAGIDAVEVFLPPPDLTMRDATGGVFDAPAIRESAPPAPGAAALLLAGWLASRLGWKVTGSRAPATVCLTRESAGGLQPPRDSAAGATRQAGPEQPGVTLTFRDAELLSCPSGWPLHSVALSTHAPRAAAYSVRVHPGGMALMAAVGVAEACPIPQCVPAREPGMSELLCQALSPGPADRVFDDALARAVEIAAALERAQPAR